MVFFSGQIKTGPKIVGSLNYCCYQIAVAANIIYKLIKTKKILMTLFLVFSCSNFSTKKGHRYFSGPRGYEKSYESN